MAPFLVLFVPMILAPMLFTLILSFLTWGISGPAAFSGLANFQGIISDPIFLQSLWQTLYFTALTVPGMVIGGIALALLVNQRVRGRNIVRVLVFLPQMASVSAVAVIGSWIFDQHYGIINHLLAPIGGGDIPWLNSSGIVLPVIAILTIWWLIGINMIIYLAGLQDIPPELYEAARLDGASWWQEVRYITLPELRMVTIFVLPITVIGQLNVFGQVNIMTNGGPGVSSFVLNQYIYTEGFTQFEFGRAAAASTVLMALTLVLTVIELLLMGEGVRRRNRNE